MQTFYKNGDSYSYIGKDIIDDIISFKIIKQNIIAVAIMVLHGNMIIRSK